MILLKPVVNQRIRFFAVSLAIVTLLLDIFYIEYNYLIPMTIRPSDANFVANPAANGEVLVHLAAQVDKPCDVIFIGASNVEFWQGTGRPVWDKYYAPRNAFNFGVGGDKTQDVLWRFDHMDLKKLKPKVAVVFVGLNNLTATPREVALGVEAIVKRTQSVFPGIKVLVLSLTPNKRDEESIEKTNVLLKQYADSETIFYIDLFSQMTPEGDNWKGLGPDRIHLTVEGYQMWADLMEPLMQKFLPATSDQDRAVGHGPVIGTR